MIKFGIYMSVSCGLVQRMLVVLWLLALALPVHAQFGKNKMQYRTFDWKFIQTEHLDIYFYDSAGLNFARFAAFVGEGALSDLQEHWRYRITNRIPVVIYGSHNDFQQTNVISEYLPEGVGGVTELFKNRVTVPFEGDWEKFRHVIHHELVHAVLNDKFYGGTLQNLIASNIRFMLPIWMNEGLAEFESQGGYDVETDMFIRDAVLGEYLPTLESMGGYFAYRGGQAFYWYVEQTYGREKIAELLNRAKAAGDLDAAFRGAFGKDIEEFSEQWVYDMKKLYFPDIADRARPRDFAFALTDHSSEESFFNTSPSLSPNGDRLAYISDRDGFRSVYLLDVASPKRVTKIVQGEENVDFEELHLLTPAITWSPDGKRISLAVKSDGRDAIYLIDVESEEQTRLVFDLDAIYSVDWSPNGQSLAFQGIKGDHTDIYVYDIVSKKLTNITRDIFSDSEPNWSADSRSIYFVSDRRNNPIGIMTSANFRIWNYDYNSRDIFSIDLQTAALRRLTETDNISETSPTPLGDDELLYISDANGIMNIHLLTISSLASRPITNSISGIEQLSASRDGSMVAFTAWNGDGQDIFLLRSPVTARVAGDTLAPTSYLARRRGALVTAGEEIASVDRVTAATSVDGYGPVHLDLADAAGQRADASSDANNPTTGSSGATPHDPRLDVGDFSVNDYKVKFTADFIQATGNYSSFYGVQGVAQLLFSDMLGNHQIYVASSLLLDLKNSDFLVSYSYLPERIDYGIEAFHSSRFFGLYDNGGDYILTRFRQWGLTGYASNPFDRFRRLDISLTFKNVSREPLDASTLTKQSKPLIVPSLTYVFDNSTMWAFNPVSGSRYFLKGLASPSIGADGVGFYTVLADARTYFSLSKYGDYSIGARISGGASFGPNPQKFFVGGMENWLNSEIRNNELPIENAEDFGYMNPGYPLRGYRYNEALGTRYMLGNLEFRFPMFRALISGPVPLLFQYVSGVMFLDMGGAWSGQFNLVGKNAEGRTVTDDLLMGTGIGLRAYVLGLPVRFDVAWRYNLDSWSRPQYYFSLGYDF